MRKILFIITIALLFSCKKDKTLDKDRCWTCTDKYGVETFRTWETCDITEVVKIHGKRWKDIYGWHYIICK